MVAKEENKTVQSILLLKIFSITTAIFAILLIILLLIMPDNARMNLNKYHKGNGNDVVEQKIVYDNISIEVLFCPNDSCENKTIQTIGSGNNIDCAYFDIDLIGILNALENKNARVVVDNENTKEISATKINFVSDTQNQYSHNKFCAIDDNIVITGSMNPTFTDAHKNSNNLLVINSKYLNINYRDEFNELWNRRFGEGERVRYPIIVDNSSNLTIENYFCPDDNCESHIVNTINSAKKSVRFLAFSFTSNNIANAIIAKQNLGLTTTGFIEENNINVQGSVFDKLNGLGVAISKSKNDKKGKLHDKIFIIDDDVIVTGSMNPTASGNGKNDENILIIHNKDIARKYLDEFERIKNQDEIAKEKEIKNNKKTK